MTIREITGLAMLVIAAAIMPLGWIISHKLLIISLLLLLIGTGLFYTDRVIKREIELAKEGSSGSGAHGHPIPADVNNYTGWRTGGRTESHDSSFSSASGDGD